MKQLVAAFAVAAGLAWPGSASAEVVGFEFEGVVTYATDLAPVGTPVTGRFAWDTDTQPSDTGFDGRVTYTAPGVQAIRVVVGPHTIVVEDTRVIVGNDLGGNAEDLVDVLGLAPVVDGTTYAAGFFEIVLASGPGHKGVLHDTALPRQLHLPQFNSQGLNSVQLHVDGTSDGVVLDIALRTLRRTTPAP